jgi:hypothetical protein
LPAYRHLVPGFAEHNVITRKTMRDSRVVEPLNEALRDESAEWLGGIAGVIEIVQMYSEKTDLYGNTRGMRTPKEMIVLFMNCATVRTAVVLEGVVTVNLVAGREPSIKILE